MIRLIAATLAGLYLIALSAEDAPEAQEVARAADPDFDMSLASFVGIAEASTAPTEELSMTDAEAIEMALMAGRDLRQGRKSSTPLLGTAAASQLVAQAEPAGPVNLWRVTGNSVNLRSGPGTSNGVVAQLSLGTEAEVLDEGDGWYRIRTADGAVDGWIFGKYLSQNG